MKAKKIRKMVYGDNSLNTERTYVKLLNGQVINNPKELRLRYQLTKKEYKNK